MSCNEHFKKKKKTIHILIINWLTHTNSLYIYIYIYILDGVKYGFYIPTLQNLISLLKCQIVAWGGEQMRNNIK